MNSYTYGSESALVPCSLEQTGGVAGDKTTQCTFTYTVSSQYGTFEDVAPAMQRPAIGKQVEAHIGIGYMSGENFILQWCDEVDDKVACPTPTPTPTPSPSP